MGALSPPPIGSSMRVGNASEVRGFPMRPKKRMSFASGGSPQKFEHHPKIIAMRATHGVGNNEEYCRRVFLDRSQFMWIDVSWMGADRTSSEVTLARTSDGLEP